MAKKTQLTPKVKNYLSTAELLHVLQGFPPFKPWSCNILLTYTILFILFYDLYVQVSLNQVFTFEESHLIVSTYHILVHNPEQSKLANWISSA